MFPLKRRSPDFVGGSCGGVCPCFFQFPMENPSNPHLKSGKFGALQPMAGCTEFSGKRFKLGDAYSKQGWLWVENGCWVGWCLSWCWCFTRNQYSFHTQLRVFWKRGARNRWGNILRSYGQIASCQNQSSPHAGFAAFTCGPFILRLLEAWDQKKRRYANSANPSLPKDCWMDQDPNLLNSFKYLDPIQEKAFLRVPSLFSLAL